MPRTVRERFAKPQALIGLLGSNPSSSAVNMYPNNINKGEIINNCYVKYVNFSKAVLWKDRQISIYKDVAENWLTNDRIKYVVFIDRTRKEIWKARLDRVKANWVLKREGQEAQYYVPIEVFITKKGYEQK